jgi:hypothetical protein
MPLFLAFALAAAAPQPAELKTFHDWTIGCDNGRACKAVALMPEEWPEDGLTMSVSRGPDAGAPLAIEIVLREEAKPVALAAAGRRLPIRFAPSDLGVSIDPADTPAFLAALRTAASLDLIGAGGARIGTVSLAGATAALLYMDEQQRRLGTPTALVRKGAAGAVPPPPPLPRVEAAAASAAPPRTLSAAELASIRRKACEDLDIEETEEPEAVRLDARTSLAMVPLRCWSGAYNMAGQLLVAGDTGGWRPALFDVAMGGPDEEGPETVYNAVWEPAERRLTTYMKGRGLGDCGVSQQFAWDGSRFRLVEQAEMGECRGSTDYITTFRAEVVER